MSHGTESVPARAGHFGGMRVRAERHGRFGPNPDDTVPVEFYQMPPTAPSNGRRSRGASLEWGFIGNTPRWTSCILRHGFVTMQQPVRPIPHDRHGRARLTALGACLLAAALAPVGC